MLQSHHLVIDAGNEKRFTDCPVNKRLRKICDVASNAWFELEYLEETQRIENKQLDCTGLKCKLVGLIMCHSRYWYLHESQIDCLNFNEKNFVKVLFVKQPRDADNGKKLALQLTDDGKVSIQEATTLELFNKLRHVMAKKKTRQLNLQVFPEVTRIQTLLQKV